MKQPTLASPLSPFANGFSILARVVAFIVTLVVVAGLVVRPDLTLTIAWYAIVPILPASFMINAGLWRSVCPLATAGMLTGRKIGGRELSGAAVQSTAAVGMLLLVVLIPVRRLTLNTDGLVLAGVLLALVVVALVAGLRYRYKAGFCNSICPIQPVEKLYGQSPLLYVRNPRCIPCNLCTRRACYDLGPEKALQAQAPGRSRPTDWLRTPTGLFVASFPGIVYGYFQTSDGAWTEWATVFGTIIGWGLVVGIVVAAMVAVLRIPFRIASPSLAALAVGTYYFFAGPSSAEALGWSYETGVALRWAFVAFTALWLAVAISRIRRAPGTGVGRARGARPLDPATMPNIH